MLEFVAFDSFGVKSMCTKIVSEDLRILIDPGIAIETNSFPLPLLDRMTLVRRYERRIRNAVKDCDVIILTHYHYDHHIPEGDLYRGKKLLIKHPTENINKSQKNRARYLLSQVNAEISHADSHEFNFGNTKIRFTEPLWHGVKNTRLGFVIATIIEHEKKIFYTSDLDGPLLGEYVDMIIEEAPDVLIVDGPATYLLGYIMSYKNLEKSIANLKKIIENVDFELMILDHHLLRDYRYPDLLSDVYETARNLDKKVISAAEHVGKRPMVLEGYEKFGPTKWKEWKKA
ncbi:MAG: MBL fold metallo-hydrolase [Euryarchaeota archaeon]|nr:MBL fold metallo-hydrolase [Euryarchaeota archaeon]